MTCRPHNKINIKHHHHHHHHQFNKTWRQQVAPSIRTRHASAWWIWRTGHRALQLPCSTLCATTIDLKGPTTTFKVSETMIASSFCVLFLKVLLLLRYFYRLLSFALGKFTSSFCKNMKSGTTNVALVPLEQIDPFVFDRIAKNQCWNYLGTARAIVSRIGIFMYCGELKDRSPHLLHFSFFLQEHGSLLLREPLDPKRVKALIGEPSKRWRMEVSCWKETISADVT